MKMHNDENDSANVLIESIFTELAHTGFDKHDQNLGFFTRKLYYI